jgi:hypothetical protein
MLSAAEILDHPDLLDVVKEQSKSFLQVNLENPRLASVFATQQRWLLAHIGLSLHFKSLSRQRVEGLTAAGFLKEVSDGQVASKNTAAAFLKEMEHYGVVSLAANETDRRKRRLVPAPTTLGAIALWVRIHLRTLDRLDGGQRIVTFDAAPESIRGLQPRIAQGLVKSTEIRDPRDAFSHFMWINSGFLMIERIFASVLHASEDGARFITDMASMAEVAAGLSLSPAHAGKKLREAEREGVLGRQLASGRNHIWVSSALIHAVLRIQAVKLSIVDHAFTAVMETEPPPHID